MWQRMLELEQCICSQGMTRICQQPWEIRKRQGRIFVYSAFEKGWHLIFEFWPAELWGTIVSAVLNHQIYDDLLWCPRKWTGSINNFSQSHLIFSLPLNGSCQGKVFVFIMSNLLISKKFMVMVLASCPKNSFFSPIYQRFCPMISSEFLKLILFLFKFVIIWS